MMSFEEQLKKDSERIKSLENWSEITKGFYRFIIAPKVCYEICIMYKPDKIDIAESIANLYFTGEWIMTDGSVVFMREVMHYGSLKQCLSTAADDYAQSLQEELSEDENH